MLVAGGWQAVPPQLPSVPSRHGPRHAGVRAVNSRVAAGKALSPQAGITRLRAGTAALAGAASTACVSIPVCTGEENAFPLGNELQSGWARRLCCAPWGLWVRRGGIPTEVPFAVLGVLAVLLRPAPLSTCGQVGELARGHHAPSDFPAHTAWQEGGADPSVPEGTGGSLAQHPLSTTAPIAAALLNPSQHPVGDVWCPTGV